MSEEQRRLTYLRENVEHLAEEKSTLESLIWNLRIGTEEDSIEILRRLRAGTDPHTLAQHVQAGRSLAQVKADGLPDPTRGCESSLKYPNGCFLLIIAPKTIRLLLLVMTVDCTNA